MARAMGPRPDSPQGYRLDSDLPTARSSCTKVALLRSPFCPSAAAQNFLASAPQIMAKTRYRFCFGPWNLSEGQDPYGPPTRPSQNFDWKLAQLKEHGFDAMMFH